MSSVSEVHALTEQLLNLLKQPGETNERDTLIQQLNSKLDEREQAMKHLIPPFSSREKQLLQEVNDWNKQVISYMNKVKTVIQLDQQRLKKTKAGANKYVNPYEAVRTDGMFYDKRK
ncbi:flagellar protein FliT [Bacillus mangrovi]|uniref:Flagellar protein FliT n=1 Tax=Metabacillus mangrovi TaxID=1491830 RepID=A0A7X2S5P1_9BACI|nr:flagellar protein FliT [Metabacillus mangrovi]MTH53710.1 flagellar protein FliT [Metabacillus mangrovi]